MPLMTKKTPKPTPLLASQLPMMFRAGGVVITNPLDLSKKAVQQPKSKFLR